MDRSSKPHPWHRSLPHILLPLLLILASGMNPPQASADPGWISHGTSEYALTETGGTWMESEAEATTWGAHLVTINDDDENLWLVDTFGTAPLWIGFYRPLGPDGGENFEWVSGDSVTYTNWQIGQPDWLWAPHDYVSINLMGDIGLWHNSEDGGYPYGNPNTGIMERPLTTSVLSSDLPSPSWGAVKKIFR